MHGRYPDYDVLEQAGHWDEVTREMVLARVHEVPEIRFFTAGEAATLGALLRPADRPGLRAADPAHQLHRREVRTRRARRLPVRRHARRPTRPGGWSPAGSTSRPRGRAGAASFAAADRRRPAGDRRGLRGGRARRAAPGSSSTSSGPSAWSCASSLSCFYSPPVGVERDRLRRAGLSARLQPLRQSRAAARRARDVGGTRGARPRPGVRRARAPPAMSLRRQSDQGRHPDAQGQRLGVAARPAQARAAEPRPDARATRAANRSTSSSSAPAPAGSRSPSGWRGPAGGS